MASESASTSTSDWVSAVSSLTATLIAMFTLVTVYIAALQLASQRRKYRLGLSGRSLGPWEKKVAGSSFFGLQRRVYTPTVNLAFLVKNKWKPNFMFPTGISKTHNPDLEAADTVHAHASWVTFMEALDLKPENDTLYQMEDASELVNGIVPMHLKGKDLVGICSTLGFQSYEANPSFRSPMPLPMLWSGPLGWLQFQSGTHGCIAQFRSRARQFNQIKEEFHTIWSSDRHLPEQPNFLQSRLWNSLDGLFLPRGETLYLGGADEHKRPLDVDDDCESSPAELMDFIIKKRYTREELRRKLLGRNEDRPKALRREVERSGRGLTQEIEDRAIPNFVDESSGDVKDFLEGKKEVLRPCPGLLTTCVQGEAAYSRGLDISQCHEYDRKFTVIEDVDYSKYPYNLGALQMGEELLQLIKDALLLLKPDGFYFSPSYILHRDIYEVYRHIEEQSNKSTKIFPDINYPLQSRHSYLHHSMKLCNELQKTRKLGRAMYSVDDMRLLAKASNTLAPIISPGGGGNDDQDLIWAMLACPTLSSNIRKSLNEKNLSDFLDAEVVCEEGVLDGTSLPNVDPALDSKYTIPLVVDATFTGQQILAALADVFIRYFWLEKKWITDVVAYDRTMPQSVTMC